MTEVAKEVASRCQEDLLGQCGDAVEERRRRGWGWGGCKITVSLKGWGEPCTFEMAGESYMHMFNRVAQAVEAKFTIEKVHCCGFWPSDVDTEVLRLIAGQVEKEGLSKLEIDIAFRRFTEKGDVLISLVEASKEWTIQTLRIYVWYFGNFEGWTDLTKNPAKGHIGRIVFQCSQPPQHCTARPKMEHVKAAWEMSEEVQVEDSPPIGGGRGGDPKITWEEAYQTLLKYIC